MENKNKITGSKFFNNCLNKFWNKFLIRTKITFLTASVLCFISVISLIFTIQNAKTIFIIDEEAYSKITEFGTDAIPAEFDFEGAQNTFNIISIVTMLLLVVAGTLLIWWVIGKALKPLQKFSRVIKQLDIKQLNQEIHIVNTSDEVGDLQTAFNYMLNNIRESYEKQRRFSQNAAHELKTPVAAIRANLEVLNMDENPSYEEYRTFTDVVERQTAAMSAIVQGLRLLSSGDNLNLIKFNLYENINQILLNLENEIARKNIRININSENRDLYIEADSVLMKQAIFNIIHNAVRYSNENEAVDITITKDKLSVKNYGMGISKENLERVFEPFYCVDKSRSKKLGGSGLGLAITKEILEEHGFGIQAESTEGEFTEFTINF